MDLIYSRTAKHNHVDTVLYEIDMLRFTTRRLLESDWKEIRDAWAYLESFLVHFRNLADFFGKATPSKTDVHVTNIWELEKLAPPPYLDKIHSVGKALLEQYEPPDAKGGGRISQYVQHLTTKRIEPKDWHLDKMLKEIDPLLAQVEEYLRPYSGAKLKPEEPIMIFGTHSASTSVATETAAAAMKIEDYLKIPED
jgi:hypothetical protein